jgi:hypothetical protein
LITDEPKGYKWWATISKTQAPGGAWLYELHGQWHGGEDDTQAFGSLRAAKAYGRAGEPGMVFRRSSSVHWLGWLPEDEEDA